MYIRRNFTCVWSIFSCMWIHAISDGTITQCLHSPTNRVRIKCPRGHVIYNPSIVTGVSTPGGCDRSPGDCVGIPDGLKSQVNRCHWKRKCDIVASNNDVISCGLTPHNTTQRINYMIIKQPYCIPKDIIFDICSPRDLTRRQRYGVIRSHRKYPEPIHFRRRTCTKRLLVNTSDELFFRVIGSGYNDSDMLSTTSLWKWENDHIYEIQVDKAMGVQDAMNVSGETVAAVDIFGHFDSMHHASIHGGYIIPFAFYTNESLDSMLGWPKGVRSLAREMGWIFEVKAVIEQCMVQTSGAITLGCDADHVIYAPQFAVAGAKHRPPVCIHGRYPCGGYTPDMLVQRNSCYWKNECTVTWRGSTPILASRHPACIGYMASTLGLSGHRCISKDNIYDACTSSREHIDVDWGVIRSHDSYPWYFDPDAGSCKRIIRVGRRKRLTVIVQDINLDPAGRDKFFISHVSGGKRRVVMTAKTARESAQLIVNGGHVRIRFRPFNETLAGRGFVLFFKREKEGRDARIFKNTKERAKDQFGLRRMASGDVASGVYLPDTIAGDRGRRHRTLSRRRRCRGRRRNRGRAHCPARLWTDYFTQWE